jgi:hypothetical protein
MEASSVRFTIAAGAVGGGADDVDEQVKKEYMSVPANKNAVPIQCHAVNGCWNTAMLTTSDKNLRSVMTKVLVKGLVTPVSKSGMGKRNTEDYLSHAQPHVFNTCATQPSSASDKQTDTHHASSY